MSEPEIRLYERILEVVGPLLLIGSWLLAVAAAPAVLCGLVGVAQAARTRPDAGDRRFPARAAAVVGGVVLAYTVLLWWWVAHFSSSFVDNLAYVIVRTAIPYLAGLALLAVGTRRRWRVRGYVAATAAVAGILAALFFGLASESAARAVAPVSRLAGRDACVTYMLVVEARSSGESMGGPGGYGPYRLDNVRDWVPRLCSDKDSP